LLVNDKELQLSVVLRMVVPQGNIGAFIDPLHANGVLLRTVKILSEEVASVADIKRLVSSYDVTGKSATHVVFGVEWGATVAVSLDHKDADIQCDQSVSENLKQQLQMLTSDLKSGSPPNSQVLSGIKSAYTVRCFTSGVLQDSQPHRTSLEDAMALLSDLPRLIQSVNNGKGAPQSFTLIPLSALAGRTASVPCRVEESILTQALALFGDVKITEHSFDSLSQCLKSCKSYSQEQDKIKEYLTGFQQTEKKLYDDVSSAVVAVRSGRLDQARLADILHAFSHGHYSADSLRAFFENIQPTLQKIQFFNDVTQEGIVIIGDSQTNLRDIIHNADVYILYATERAKHQNFLLWEENSIAFVDIVREEKRKHVRTSGIGNLAKFAYIDCDVVRRARVDEGIAIYRYKRGQVVSRNAAEERAIIASLNIAESSQTKQPFTARSMKRAIVELPCPGATSRCGSNQRTWSCEVCKEQMEYGFDDYFYCSCGRAPMKSFSYKCNGSSHGDDFLAFQPSAVENHARNMKPIQELNILFLGETGVGKSTWINGFANYISYSTLSEAENSDNVCVIPTKFAMMNENYEEVEVKSGTDANEDQQVGQSSTQMPKSYVFRHGRTDVRIIDTPGIGDTRGIDHDRINFDHIMTHLSDFDEINGICILLKPNNARLSVMFKFCIKELLTHLHRDACKNIVFCFTNARGTFYKPGDSLPALRELIKSNKIDLQLRKETIYCIDNESVRFLAALKQGIKFDEDAKKNYSTSWEMSVKETDRLIDYISSLQRHKVKNTLSLNGARRFILVLSRPLAEITSTIQSNIIVAEQRRQKILESTKDKDDLAKNYLYIPAVDLETTPIDFPRTVCTAHGCVKHISVGAVQKIDYKTHCHPHCYLTGVQKNTVNCVALQKCAAMNEQHQCTKCGCDWSVHMHITYDCQQVQTQIVDKNVEKQIREKATVIEIIQQHLQSLQDRIKALEDEKRQVAKVSAEFACFLKHNAIAPYNDAICDYLDRLIEDEKNTVSAGGDRTKLTGLEKMKSMYKEEVKILEEAIKDSKSGVRVPSAEKIMTLYNDLRRLPTAGPMLEGAVNVADSADVRAMQKCEKIVQPHGKQRRSGNSASHSRPQRGWAGRFGYAVGYAVGRFLKFM